MTMIVVNKYEEDSNVFFYITDRFTSYYHDYRQTVGLRLESPEQNMNILA